MDAVIAVLSHTCDHCNDFHFSTDTCPEFDNNFSLCVCVYVHVYGCGWVGVGMHTTEPLIQ